MRFERIGSYDVTALIGEGAWAGSIGLASIHRILLETVDTVGLPVYEAVLSSLEGGVPFKEL